MLARLRDRGAYGQASQLQPRIQRPASGASRGPSDSLQEAAEARGLQVSLVNIHTRPPTPTIRLPQALGQLHHPETGGGGSRWRGAIPGGAPAAWIGVGLPVGEARRGPGGSRGGRGIRRPWASRALIVRGDAGDLKATFLLPTAHGPWGSGLGSGGGGAGLLERGSGTSGTGGPHGGDIGAPGDVRVRHGRRALWELGVPG